MNIPENSHIVVYTVCLNNYDVVNPPPENDNDNIEYILFTDSDEDVQGWKRIKVDTGGTRASRYLKINSHLIDEYCNKRPDYTIYVDSCLFLKDNWLVNLFNKMNNINHYNISEHKDKLFNHINKMVALKGFTTKTSVELKVQKERYKNEKLPEDYKVTENCLIIRKNSEEVKNINEKWWHEYSITSERDQPSLSYVIWKNEYESFINYLQYNARDNDIYGNWCKHKTGSKSKNTLLIKRMVKINDTSKLRVCVCTTFVSLKETPNKFYETCIKSIENFALRNNYDFKVITELGKWENPSWCRFEFKKLLDEDLYDVILYIDGDIYIKDNAIDPLGYYPLDGITALNSVSTYSYMRSSATMRRADYTRRWKETFNEDIPFNFPDRTRYINAGVLIIPKCCKEFLEEPPRILNDKDFLEQTYLNCQTTKFKYYELDPKWNTGHVQLRDNMKKAVSSDSQFIHFNCPKTVSKEKLLEKLLEGLRT